MDVEPAFLGDENDSLVEVLDRVLHTGVVAGGDVTISVADIDLIYLRLQLLLSSVETARGAGCYGWPAGARSSLETG